MRMVENQNAPLTSHTAEGFSEQRMEKGTIFLFENNVLGIGLLDALIQPSL